jgi:hypothetical protein
VERAYSEMPSDIEYRLLDSRLSAGWYRVGLTGDASLWIGGVGVLSSESWVTPGTVLETYHSRIHNPGGARRLLSGGSGSVGSAGFGSAVSVIVASASSSVPATETAFSRAMRTTFVGWISSGMPSALPDDEDQQFVSRRGGSLPYILQSAVHRISSDYLTSRTAQGASTPTP